MAKVFNYDFAGWATKNNYKCSDGRIIHKDAFLGNDGKKVPLVWMHQHDDIKDVLGHAILQNREEGVYCYCSLNGTENADIARDCLDHGDITALSIYANQLKEKNKNVFHGDIKEVSLVIAGANPGARIEHVMMHSDDGNDTFSAQITFELDDMIHADGGTVDLDAETEKSADAETAVKEEADTANDSGEDTGELAHADNAAPAEGESLEDVLGTLNEKQQIAVEYLLRKTAEKAIEATANKNKEENTMKHGLFEETKEKKITVDPEQVKGILAHALKPNVGSLKQACYDFVALEAEEGALRHDDDSAGDDPQEYGIRSIEDLFPNAKGFTNTPEFIKRRTEWVNVVLTGTRTSPFSKFKSTFADITADEARAKGYTKGNRKLEEVFGLLKRETAPTTIYKKQRIDRDDMLDITDFDVALFLKGEMRLMWEEEAARAMLVGDGRDALSVDKIKEDKIRPIWTDDPLFTVPERVTFTAAEMAETYDQQRTKKIIRKFIKARKDYRGSGNPILFTTEDFVSDCLLLEDGMGRPMYDTVEKLATALRVSRIVTVPVMEGLSRSVEVSAGVTKTCYLVGIVVNLSDYNKGADKGAQAQMFDDFDINFNQNIYLYEGRFSGALVKPYSALAFEYYISDPT